MMDVVSQHRVILSEKIIEYYLHEADDNYRGVVESYIESIANIDDASVFYASTGDATLSAKKEMISLVERNPMKVLFSEAIEFDGLNLKQVKLITPNQMLDRKRTALLKYTFPVSNYIAEADENCESYATWFGHVLENETNIEIQDRYIMKPAGIEVLKKYYFPHFPRGAEVQIYCELFEGITRDDICSAIADPFFSDWVIHVYICNNMHDRFIQVDGIQISIGAGLDFLHLSGKTKKTCTLNITNHRERIPLPEIIDCII